MIETNEITTEKLACEACGKFFECGANTGKCWCFEVELDGEKLAELRDNFKSCLCRECLLSHEQTRKDSKNASKSDERK